MSETLDRAIDSVLHSAGAFCRFITANDTSANASHQYGFLLPIAAYPLLFGKQKQRGGNEEIWVTVQWHNEFETNNRIIYYGKAKNELRITRFGKNFPFFEERHVGDLLVIAKITDENYEGFVLGTDDDIENFLSYFSLSPEKHNQLIDTSTISYPTDKLHLLISSIISPLKNFPETSVMSEVARKCYNDAFRITPNKISKQPDSILLGWRDAEEELFKCLEEKVYSSIISQTFNSVERFAEAANIVLNRRKSRAGKSLEHHLSAIFTANALVFEEQAVTENNKKPDFLFPNSQCYHNFEFPADDLTVLGAKTTCKDRWRQILSEADRVDIKYLCTLQPGISSAQLHEMEDSHVQLVVPKSVIPSYPKEYQSRIYNLEKFIGLVKEKQARIPKHYLL